MVFIVALIFSAVMSGRHGYYVVSSLMMLLTIIPLSILARELGEWAANRIEERKNDDG